LLSYVFDDNELLIAVNSRIAEATLGRIFHARIEINEARELESDIACLIHQWLCAWVDPGEKKQIRLTTIIRYLWEETKNAETRQKRRQYVRKAMKEFEKIGWKVTEQRKEQYEIPRPKLIHLR
jgi:Zn-dependent oligopeptidase